MKILALEFSSAQRSVALLVHGQLRGVATRNGGRGVPAFEMIEEALGRDFEREEIECVMVGLGPGSYTGIRSAIALAQGWQLARPVKLLGIDSVECLALNAQRQGWLGIVNLVIDAQRNEFYLARYKISPHGRREIAPLKLASSKEVSGHADAGEILAGPEAEKFFPNGRNLFPEAGDLAQLAAGRTDFVSGENLEPVYLRETNFVKAPPPRILPAR